MPNEINLEVNEVKITTFEVNEAKETIDLNLENINIISENDYEKLIKKPRINEVELKGNKTLEDLGLEECLNQDIEDMFK